VYKQKTPVYSAVCLVPVTDPKLIPQERDCQHLCGYLCNRQKYSKGKYDRKSYQVNMQVINACEQICHAYS